MLQAGTKNRPAIFVYHFLWTAADWLFPPICGGCDELGTRWCDKCSTGVVPLGDQICSRCGTPLLQAGLCQECEKYPPPYDALRSYGFFHSSLRHAIHRLKYHRDLGLAEVLAQMLYTITRKENWKFDLITAVPLSLQHQQERGYNQSNLLAFPLALSLGLPFRPRAIQRIRHTRPQVGLNRKERLENVKDAFQADAGIVKDQRVLIIDDVTTTGATIRACAEALKSAKAEQVFVITVGRAVPPGSGPFNEMEPADDSPE